MKPLINAFHELGVQCRSVKGDGNPPLIVRGPNTGRWAHIKGDVSSQFISSLLISSPLKELDTEIVLTTPLISKPYVDITIDMMSRFGVKVDITKDGYHILGGQRYSPHSFTIPGDYSSAAYPLAAGALTGRMSLSGLDPLDKQGDRQILDILQNMGASLSWKEGRVEVSRSTLSAVEVDMSDCPDLFPIVAVLASQAKGKSRLYNAQHLRLKESDRIKTTTVFLKSMGARVEEREDGCVVTGPASLRGREVDSHGDHRILMAAAVAGMVADGRTVISEASSYEVSYPSFLTDMKEAGAIMEAIS
jgi:3-phosphoshikimate 1-carboxyvinyltransferase